MTGTLYARLAALLLAVSAAAVAVADEKGRMEAAMAAPDRLAADVERDGREHPATILALLNIGPGSRVADIFAGGGYYSELIGRVVAPDGVVLMHNNKPYVEFAAKGIVERFEGREVVGVVRHDREPDDLDLGRTVPDRRSRGGSGQWRGGRTDTASHRPGVRQATHREPGSSLHRRKRYPAPA